MRSVLAIVLGGGAGSRLFPLTAERSKPAVPFAGKYRIIDVPISNCINSNINRIYILTQYNSASLNHHVTNTYRFSGFSRGFVNILAAEITPRDTNWFQGTADAVRQVLHHLLSHPFEHVLILSGDQLYQMDLNALLEAHSERGAAITVATTPVTAREASAFGIMKTDRARLITQFVEKPKGDAIHGLESHVAKEMEEAGRVYLASMGIYVFDRAVLVDLLTSNPQLMDFGKDVIPHALWKLPVYSWHYDGYWTDIGTIDSFFAANLELTSRLPRLDLYDADKPIYTHARMLPPEKIQDCRIDSSILGQGAILEGAHVQTSVIGVRSIVRDGAHLHECVIMGADFYQSAAEREADLAAGIPPVGIGQGARLERCIVDKNARIGRGVVVRGDANRPDADGPGWHARDGVVVIPKGAIVVDGTEV